MFLDGLAQEFFSLLCLDRRVEVLFLNGRVDSQGVSELLKQRLLPRAGYVLDLLEHLFDLVVLFFEQFKGVHRCLRKGLNQVGDVAARFVGLRLFHGQSSRSVTKYMSIQCSLGGMPSCERPREDAPRYSFAWVASPRHHWLTCMCQGMNLRES